MSQKLPEVCCHTRKTFIYLQQIRRLQGVASKAVTPHERVNGFLLFRLRLDISLGKPCHPRWRWAEGRTCACIYNVCHVNEAEVPPWAEILV